MTNSASNPTPEQVAAAEKWLRENLDGNDRKQNGDLYQCDIESLAVLIAERERGVLKEILAIPFDMNESLYTKIERKLKEVDGE